MLKSSKTCIFIAALISIKSLSLYGQQALPQNIVLYCRGRARFCTFVAETDEICHVEYKFVGIFWEWGLLVFNKNS